MSRPSLEPPIPGKAIYSMADMSLTNLEDVMQDLKLREKQEEEPMGQNKEPNNISEEAMDVDPAVPTAMEVDDIKRKSLRRAFHNCSMFNPWNPAKFAWDPAIFDFTKPKVSSDFDFNKPVLSSPASALDLNKPGLSSPALAFDDVKRKSLCRPFHNCSMFNPWNPAKFAWDPAIFDFAKPKVSSDFDFNKPVLSSPASASNHQSIFEFQKPNILEFKKPSASNHPSIFEFKKPNDFDFKEPGVSSPASASHNQSIFEFKKPNIFEFEKPSNFHYENPPPSSSLASGSNPPRSIFDFQVPSSTRFQQPFILATNHASPADLLRPPPSIPANNWALPPSASALPLPEKYRPLPVPQIFRGSALLRTGEEEVTRSTPRPPRPTKLVDLDPNSVRARGLLRHYGIAVRLDDDELPPRFGDVFKAMVKIWERGFDPDPSPDPLVRNFQDAIDKVGTPAEETPVEETPSEDLTDSMDSVGDIHRETLKCLPKKISTTSHFRHVLARLRMDKARLLQQIKTDRDLVAAMDATLAELRSGPGLM